MISRRDMGRWIRIVFWDHCIVEQDFPKPRARPKPVLCEASGMIRNVTSTHITLAHWWVMDEDNEVQDTNSEITVIVRSTVVKYGWCEIFKWIDD